MLIAVIVALVILAILIAGVVIYNTLAKAKVAVAEGWSQIDVQLTRRADLIPNLIATVKGAAGFEKGTLQAVTDARAALMNAGTVGEKAAGDNMLTQALGKLFAVAEAYPQLTATANFAQLQESLNETENKVAFARQYYNDAVRNLNTKIATIPWMFMAGIAKAEKAEFFEAPEEARALPKVEF